MEERSIPMNELIIRRLAEYSEPGHWQILPGTEVSVREIPDAIGREISLPIPPEHASDSFNRSIGCFECHISEPLARYPEIPSFTVRCLDTAHYHTYINLAISIIDSGTKDPGVVLQLLYTEINKPDNQLSAEEASGLFGELYFMARWLDGSWDSRVNAWVGPEGSPKDFRWGGEPELCIEVKTTQQTEEPFVHLISSLEQLSYDDSTQLALFSMSAEPNVDGEESLGGLVNEIMEHIRGDQNLLDEFLKKVNKAGYNPAMQPLHFSVQELRCRLYLVDDDFPRLVSSDTSGHGQMSSLDERISISKYSIRMEGLEQNQLGLQPPVTPSEIISHIAERSQQTD